MRRNTRASSEQAALTGSRSARKMGSCEAHRLETRQGSICHNRPLGTVPVAFYFGLREQGVLFAMIPPQKIMSSFHVYTCHGFGRHAVGNLIEWSPAMKHTISGQLMPVFVDHDRSSHAERQALLAILGCLLAKTMAAAGVIPEVVASILVCWGQMRFPRYDIS